MSGIGLFGGFAVTQQATRAISDIEQATLKIRKVSVEQSADFNKLRDNLIELGIQYGQTADQVMESAIIWSQAGYRVKEVQSLTRVSLLAQTVADMPADESVKLLISALKQYNMEVDQAITVLDKANEVSNNFAITARDVFHALSVTGQMAKNAGIDLDTLVGYIVALAEATGRSGREIGNALKSIIAFSQRPKSIKFFEEIGVAVVDATGNYRAFTDVLMDLSIRWKGTTEEQKRQFDLLAEEAGLLADAMEDLTDVEKTQLAQAGANLFRRNLFISLMERMSDAVKATEVSMKSAGSAEREHAIFAESHALKVNQLKSAFAALAVQIGDSGLLNIMKGLVDGTREAVVAFERLPESTQNAVIWFGILGSVLGLTTLTMRTFTGVGIGHAVIGLANLILQAQGATRSVHSMGAAFQVLAASKVVWFWGALAFVAYTAYKQIKKANEEIERTIKESPTLVQRKQDEIKTIQQLVDEYKQLSDKVDKTEAEKTRLEDVTKRIAEIMPSAVSGYDSLGRAILNVGTVASVSKWHIEQLNAEIMKVAKQAHDVALGQAPKAKEELDIAKAQRDYWQGVVSGRITHGVSVWTPIPGVTETRPLSPEEREQMKERLAFWEGEVERRQEEVRAIERAMAPWLSSYTGLMAPQTGVGTGTKLPGAERPRFSEAWLTGGTEAIWKPGVYDWDKDKDPGGKAGKEPPTWLQLFSDALKEAIPPDLLRSLYETEDALSSVRRESELLTGVQGDLSERLRALTLTQADYNDLQHAIQSQLFLTRRETTMLNQQNDVLNQQLPHLNARLEEAVAKYREMEQAQNVKGMREAAEAIEQTRKALEAVHAQVHANIRAMGDADRKVQELTYSLKTLGTVGYESAWEVEKQLNELKNPFDALVNYIRKARDLEHKREIKRIQDERDATIRAIEEKRDAFIEASNARIAVWQRELDQMSLERELASEMEELAKAEEELAQARERLANIPANVRVLTESGWAWVQDPAKVGQAQEDVKKAEERLAKTREDIAYNARRRELQNLIENEREQQRARVESYNQQIQDQKDFWDTRISEANAYWERMLDDDKIRGDAWIEQLKGTLNQALEAWRTYYQQLQQMAQASSGGYSYAGGPSDSSTRVFSEGEHTYTNTDGVITKNGRIIPPENYKYIPPEIGGLRPYQFGGPVWETGPIFAHKGEYVIPANVMKNFQLPAGTPEQFINGLARRVGQSIVNNTQVDRSIKLLGPVNMPHVYDVSGFLRNLKMLAST